MQVFGDFSPRMYCLEHLQTHIHVNLLAYFLLSNEQIQDWISLLGSYA